MNSNRSNLGFAYKTVGGDHGLWSSVHIIEGAKDDVSSANISACTFFPVWLNPEVVGERQR